MTERQLVEIRPELIDKYRRFGKFHEPLRSIRNMFGRIIGNYEAI